MDVSHIEVRDRFCIFIKSENLCLVEISNLVTFNEINDRFTFKLAILLFAFCLNSFFFLFILPCKINHFPFLILLRFCCVLRYLFSVGSCACSFLSEITFSNERTLRMALVAGAGGDGVELPCCSPPPSGRPGTPCGRAMRSHG